MDQDGLSLLRVDLDGLKVGRRMKDGWGMEGFFYRCLLNEPEEVVGLGSSFPMLMVPTKLGRKLAVVVGFEDGPDLGSELGAVGEIAV